MGFLVKIEKTRYMCIGNEPSKLDLENGQEISACQNYVYLGVTFNSTGSDTKEIEKRMIQARKIIGCLNSIFWNKEITKKRKFNYETIVKSTLLYGAETWRITEKYKAKVEVIEMDAMRRSLRISRGDRVRNEVIKEQMNIEDTIRKDIDKKQLTWYGHVCRMPETRLPREVLEWQPMERRRRGRPKLEWQQAIQKSKSERNLKPEDCEDHRG